MSSLRAFILLLFFSGFLSAQAVFTDNDIKICNSKFQIAVDKKLKDKPINEIVAEIGKSFIGLDYESGALDKLSDEKLTINLQGLDCYTFIENSLALARCIKNGKTEFEDYLKEIRNIRYRNGKIEDYASRLHYFTDWIFDCSERGIVKDVTKELSGIPYRKIINFMSAHTAAYKQLKDNMELTAKIALLEKEISARKYYYIPKESITDVEAQIQNGDLIAITTSIEGLDVSHLGIAVKKNDGKIYLMHAPAPGKKIQISGQALADYLYANKKQTGIIVVRPQ